MFTPTDVHQFAPGNGTLCYYCHLHEGGLIHDVHPGDTPEQVQAAQARYDYITELWGKAVDAALAPQAESPDLDELAGIYNVAYADYQKNIYHGEAVKTGLRAVLAALNITPKETSA